MFLLVHLSLAIHEKNLFRTDLKNSCHWLHHREVGGFFCATNWFSGRFKRNFIPL